MDALRAELLVLRSSDANSRPSLHARQSTAISPFISARPTLALAPTRSSAPLHWMGWQRDVTYHLPSDVLANRFIDDDIRPPVPPIFLCAAACSEAVLSCTATLDTLRRLDLCLLVVRPKATTRLLRLGLADDEVGLHYVKADTLVEIRWRLPSEEIGAVCTSGRTPAAAPDSLQSRRKAVVNVFSSFTLASGASTISVRLRPTVSWNTLVVPQNGFPRAHGNSGSSPLYAP
jgi:hypothetical protein